MSKLPRVASILAILSVAACSTPPSTPLASVPDALRPGFEETLTQIVPAKGVQIYECRAKKDAGGAYEWAFVGPEADLYGVRGAAVGRHYGGPHWEAADGSKVVGTLKARADAPLPGAIPWLLLNAKSVGPEGAFSKVTSIQRLNTVGGAAPKDGCTPATAGKPARVPYTADYHFFSGK